MKVNLTGAPAFVTVIFIVWCFLVGFIDIAIDMAHLITRLT